MGRPRGTAALVAVLSALAVARLAGCAAAGSSPDAAPSGDPDAILLCQGVEVPARALREPRSATELPEDVVAVFEHPNSPVVGRLSDWLIAVEQRRVRRHHAQARSALDLGEETSEPRHRLDLGVAGPAMPLAPPWGRRFESCTPRSTSSAVAHGSDLRSTPRRSPSPTTNGSPCSSPSPRATREARPPTGSTRRARRDPTTVGVVIGVRPHEDGMARTCISNPPTPFTVDLEHPLGDRVIMNAAVVPQREIALPEGPRT